MRFLASFLVVGLVGVACASSPDADIDDAADQAGARAAAETLRLNLLARDVAGDDGEHLREVAVIEEATDAIPGNPEISGIEDLTGDGRDDDGHVIVHVGDEAACISISPEGDAVDVEGGICP